MKRMLLTLLVIAFGTGAALGQDAHYWNNQYGTKAELLGGLVVGSRSDLSATFYNPAWVGLGTDPSLLLTTRAFEQSRLTLDNATGGEDAEYARVRPSPGFFAGQFKHGAPKGWTVAWSYLERTRFRFDVAGQVIHAEADTVIAAEASRQMETNEYWYGATFARRLGEHTAFGATTYVAYRSQNQRNGIDGAAVAGAAAASLHVTDDFSAHQLRVLAKLGLAYDAEPFSCGLAVTTPSLGVMGSGEVHRSASLVGVDRDNDGIDDPYLAATSQNDLDGAWKTPLSVAAGASLRFGRSGLHVTAEWFDAVRTYDVITAAPYVAQAGGGTVVPVYEVGLNSLVNFGVGFDHRLSDRFAFYGGFRSDFAARDEGADDTILMSSWDLWHATAGASFRFLGAELTTGLEYSYGNGHVHPGQDVEGGTGIPVDALQDVEVSYRRLKLLLGLDLALLLGGD